MNPVLRFQTKPFFYDRQVEEQSMEYAMRKSGKMREESHQFYYIYIGCNFTCVSWQNEPIAQGWWDGRWGCGGGDGAGWWWWWWWKRSSPKTMVRVICRFLTDTYHDRKKVPLNNNASSEAPQKFPSVCSWSEFGVCLLPCRFSTRYVLLASIDRSRRQRREWCHYTDRYLWFRIASFEVDATCRSRHLREINYERTNSFTESFLAVINKSLFLVISVTDSRSRRNLIYANPTSPWWTIPSGKHEHAIWSCL